MVGNEWRKAIGKLPCLSLRIPQMLHLLDQGFDAAVNSRFGVGGSEDRSGEWGGIRSCRKPPCGGIMGNISWFLSSAANMVVRLRLAALLGRL